MRGQSGIVMLVLGAVLGAVLGWFAGLEEAEQLQGRVEILTQTNQELTNQRNGLLQTMDDLREEARQARIAAGQAERQADAAERAARFSAAIRNLQASQAATGGASGSIQVLAPNGNETLCMGETFEIKWSYSGPVSNVTVSVGPPGGGGQRFVVGVFPASNNQPQGSGEGSLSWTVGEHQVFGGLRLTTGPEFEISIVGEVEGSEGTRAVNDRSDAAFAISDCSETPTS